MSDFLFTILQITSGFFILIISAAVFVEWNIDAEAIRALIFLIVLFLISNCFRKKYRI